MKQITAIPAIIAAIFIVPAAARAEILLHADFDAHPLGQYTTAMARADFPYPGYTWYNGMDQGWGEIVQDRNGEGKALRMLYPAGSVGPNESAINIRAALKNGTDTAWASYRVMFEDGFDFVRGGKLPGLCGGRCITGGNDADGYNGWSARIMWRSGGTATQYVYYTANEGYGEDMLFDKVPPTKQFIPGKWHRLQTQIIMNTPGVANGIIRTYFDGELSLERTDLLIRHTDTLNINLFYISTFFGGSDQSWAPPRDTYITFDDFLVVSDLKSSPYPEDQIHTGINNHTNRPITANNFSSVSVKQYRNGMMFTIPPSSGQSQSQRQTQTQIEIFNAKGVLVARRFVSGASGINATNGNNNFFIPVKSKGLYIYRVRFGGDALRGTVVVR